jgi:(2R)-3-sulfolactate dehydrogenase (NADP+)
MLLAMLVVSRPNFVNRDRRPLGTALLGEGFLLFAIELYFTWEVYNPMKVMLKANLRVADFSVTMRVRISRYRFIEQKMTTYSIQQARDLVKEILVKAGASAPMALSTAKALVLAESQGLSSHGLGRVAQYVTHLKNGRANGSAVPSVSKRKGAAFVIDAQQGLAFPACDLAIEQAICTAQQHGVAFVGVINSHHCGVVIDHLRAVADAGLVGIGFANSPAAMPMAGGKHAVFGTNPIAAIFPRRTGLRLMLDLSLSEVARGKLMIAANKGESIPLGWALDSDGNPTTDPKAGMDGFMLPIGAASSSKGSVLALMVELLVSAVIGAHFSYEADTFFVDAGNQPRIGQAFIVIDPAALSGAEHYFNRMEAMIAEMLIDEDVRLPGARREAIRLKAEADGIVVANSLIAQWREVSK